MGTVQLLALLFGELLGLATYLHVSPLMRRRSRRHTVARQPLRATRPSPREREAVISASVVVQFRAEYSLQVTQGELLHRVGWVVRAVERCGGVDCHGHR